MTYWTIEGNYLVHRDTGYECYLLANLGDHRTWIDHVKEKSWATPACVAELCDILAALGKRPAIAQFRPIPTPA